MDFEKMYEELNKVKNDSKKLNEKIKEEESKFKKDLEKMKEKMKEEVRNDINELENANDFESFKRICIKNILELNTEICVTKSNKADTDSIIDLVEKEAAEDRIEVYQEFLTKYGSTASVTKVDRSDYEKRKSN